MRAIDDVRITFAVDGGFAVFPGLARPVTIDVDGSPDADALKALVERSDFFDREEPRAVAARGAADERRYVVTVDDGSRSRTLTIPESTDDASLKSLVGALDDRARRLRAR